MELIKVTTTEDCIKSTGEENFKFVGGLLVSIDNEQTALFISKDEAINWLFKDGFDEVDITLMDFSTFRYIPQIKSEDEPQKVIPYATIYEGNSKIGLCGDSTICNYCGDIIG